MDDDTQREPATPGSKDPTDSNESTDPRNPTDSTDSKDSTGEDADENEAARADTAEFRIPANVSLTRPDISIRRPAPEPRQDEADDEPEEPAPSSPQGPWHVQFPKPAPEDTEEAEAPEEPEEPEDVEDPPAQTPPAPQQQGPRRAELPTTPPPAPQAPVPPAPAPPAQTAPTQPTPTPPAPAEDAPRTGGSGAGPTRVEPLPVPPPPSQTPPSPAAPSQTAPSQTAPPQTAPSQAAPSQAAPSQTAPSQTAPPQTAPSQAAPSQAPPSQAAPPQAAPPQGAPSQGAPPQLPAARSSGQWTVPWDGRAPGTPASPPPSPPQPPLPQPPLPQPPLPQPPLPQPPLPQPPVPPAPLPMDVGAEAGAEPRRGRRWLVVVSAALVLVAGVVAGQLVRPVPEPSVELAIASSHAFPGRAPALPWPSAGQAAVEVDGLGTMGSSGASAPIPTASVAKVMTAYVYLREHPLKQGEAGPVLTVSPQAAAQIPMRERRGESILGVTANQRLTQRKALEALLIISANDVAHELARWDAGDARAFVAKMNTTAAELGMTSTRYTDPSGYHSGTVSTAADQVKLLRAAMNVPAFAEIVNNRTYVPDSGGQPREGGNFLLGQAGVVGGKTGYTDAAGGNFVFAARKAVAGVNTLIIGAVMGQKTPTAAGAVNAAGRLVTAAESALAAATLAPKGARVARVDDGLGGKTPLRAATPVTVVGWPGLTVPVRVQGEPPRQGQNGERIATVTAGAARVPLELGQALNEPSILKRLIRLA
ncbi:hypothetical protein OHR68_02965 [Spirillospora sp. NBC_00431]